MSSQPEIVVIGGGLAGTEAAWQAAEYGLNVHLYEMRPHVTTGAHVSSNLAELVCSNSLGSTLPDRASGLLKEELTSLRSFLLSQAQAAALPAGSALAVDRNFFSERVTSKILEHPRITVIRKEVIKIPDGLTIIATGPLTSPLFTRAIQDLTGNDQLFFYDAIAPIVSASSINMDIAYRASRFGRGTQIDGDYLNCPLTQEEYEAFVEQLINAEKIPLRDFEKEILTGVTAGDSRFFEGCLPVEEIARRGLRSLAFGPMRPIGLRDPRTGKRPYAVLQMRQDNLSGDLYNLVGFQTNLLYNEQKRVFRMIPGLERAEFHRYGQMHRNTYLSSPRVLLPTLQYKGRPNLFFAGQLTGVEGYLGNIGTGLLAGINAARLFQGKSMLTLPQTTMLGALCTYITRSDLQDFQPMKANFGILPPLEKPGGLGKKERALAYHDRSLSSMREVVRTFIQENEPIRNTQY